MHFTIGRTFIQINLMSAKPNILLIAPIDDELMVAVKISVMEWEAAPILIEHFEYKRGDKSSEKLALDGNWGGGDA